MLEVDWKAMMDDGSCWRESARAGHILSYESDWAVPYNATARHGIGLGAVSVATGESSISRCVCRKEQRDVELTSQRNKEL